MTILAVEQTFCAAFVSTSTSQSFFLHSRNSLAQSNTAITKRNLKSSTIMNNIQSKHPKNLPYLQRSTRNTGGTSTELYDLSGWRDLFFDEESTPNSVTKRMKMDTEGPPVLEGPPRQVCVLPFPLTDVLLQGETKELCLYENRFHQLFQKCQNEHEGIVAMGLMAPPDGILQIMSLCEVDSYRKMETPTAFGTDYSILATIRSVGRAALLQLNEGDDLPYMVGWCAEVFDDQSSQSSSSSPSTFSFSSTSDESIDAILGSSRNQDTVKVANNLANKAEEMLDSLSNLEERLSLSGGSASSNSSSGNTGTLEDLFNIEDDDDEEDDVLSSSISDGLQISEASMRRRLLEAELDEMDNDEEDEEDDDDDDFDDDEAADNRKSRFQLAYKNAKVTDMQGYRITATDSSTEGTDARSIQELTALSWAYFCSEVEDDATNIIQYRLRALDCMDLRERLTLALVMMMEQRSKIKATLSGSSLEDDEEL